MQATHRAQNESPTPKKPLHRGGALFGISIILIGVLLLLDQFAYLAPYHVFDFWPLLLILAGIAKFSLPGASGHILSAAAMVLAGVLIQLYLLDIVQYNLYSVWPLAIIGVGLHIVVSNIRNQARSSPKHSPDVLEEFIIFGGAQIQNRSQHFQGGSATAIFGGCDIDLTHASLDGHEAVIFAHAIFGGVDIRVPTDWQVTIQGIGILGGYEDKSIPDQHQVETQPCRLTIKGYAIFGGVDVEN